MSKYHNDQPIYGGIDDPDLLNRLSFANGLANVLLLNCEDECLTVSLEGEWGNGKTSVINLIKGALQEKETYPAIIEYNPWLAGNPESLIQDFLVSFSAQLNLKDKTSLALKVSKELVKYASLFNIAKLVPGTEPWASILEKVFSKFSSATKKTEDLKELDLLSKKNKVSKEIQKLPYPIIIIIDDIDRLTPTETFQVLRLVKAVADFPGTSFLLAFDPNYLTEVLKKNGIENSAQYINKIVQLRVPLPVISESSITELAEIEFSNLSENKLTENFENDQERLSWIFHNYFKHLIKNPREIKKLFNHLRFILAQVEGQVCFSDLFALSLIAIKSNSLYEHIKNNPEAYIGKRFTNDGLLLEKPEEIVKTFDNERNHHLQIFNDKDRRLMINLLGEVFPLLASGGYSHYGVTNPDYAGRVSAPQRLHVAFHYETPIGYLSDQDIIKFIRGEISRSEFLIDVESSNSEDRFFEMMTNYSNIIDDDAFDILKCIYDKFLFSEKLIISQESNYGFLSSDLYRKINWLTNKVISESTNKNELIKSIISRKENTPLGADVLYKVRRQLNGTDESNPWITQELLDKLEITYQHNALDALTTKRFIKNHLESHIFLELRRSSKHLAAQFIDNLINKKNGIIRIAEVLKRAGSDSVNGPYAQIDESNFGDIIDLEKLKNKVGLLDITDYSYPVQAALKSILDGGKYYLRDATKSDNW